MIRSPAVITVLLLLALAVVPAAMAQQNLIITVDRPVIVPSGVLSPGKYQLRFADPQFRIVSLTREDGSTVGMFRVMRTERTAPTDEAQLVVGSLANGSQALEGWSSPGERSGYAFEYEQKPGFLAMKNPQPIGKK